MFAKRTRSLLCLYTATAFCSLNPMLSYAEGNELPDIGTVAGATLSIDQELQYGDAYMRIIRGTQPVINDPVMSEYVDTLGHRLVSHAQNVKTPFHFFLINDQEINAFAFFGGYVALHSGLFLYTQSESELASVMAHEISHVTQRHLARSMEDQAKQTPATIAALAGSLLLAIAAPTAGIAAITATTAGSLQGRLNYTRAYEKEADRFGMQVLAKSGFDVMAMPRFFSRLAAESRYSSKPPEMLLTHPLPQSRITDSRERAQSYPQIHPKASLRFNLARARAIARYAGLSEQAALAWFNRTEQKTAPSVESAFEYGKALVYLDNKKLQQSEKILSKLLKSDPDNDFYLDGMSDLYLALKQAPKAQAMLKKALDENPDNSVLLINYANVLLKEEKYESAIQVLHRYTHDHPDDPNGWSLLSEASSRLGNSEEDLAARAELLALKAQWNKAIQYYTQASQIAKLGSLEQARYDARIDQLIVQRERFMALQK
ncbi:M48 family metalloprotease [Vibrio sp. CAIM 722]|uniref:Putative beta-barrel assembly-enhancing protease n=1 Tax=Vibrio eleionomae TaxID=2653505 RepID=A0A7X4RTG2_9VIBR|nr:M48 family metallopeptidase [Vibrio eleionomae]MZI92034.1 M48 family metalloprotease [Vibrio eleionomae]